ncbi:hypothetical protein D3C80_1426260 [compost metagenome]
MDQNHIEQHRSIVLEALGADDRVLAAARLAHPRNDLLLAAAIGFVAPSRFHCQRPVLAPRGDGVQNDDGQNAEKDRSQDEGKDELPGGNTCCARDNQFITSIERDQRRHAHEKGDEGNGLLQDQRQAKCCQAKCARNRIARHTGHAPRRLAEIREIDDRRYAEHEPYGGYQISFQEIPGKRVENHALPLPELRASRLENRRRRRPAASAITFGIFGLRPVIRMKAAAAPLRPGTA